jgi:hypothetical protein
MKYGVIIGPEAEDDFKDAYSWYEEKRQGLGHDFLLNFDAGLNYIQRNPASCHSERREEAKNLRGRVSI